MPVALSPWTEERIVNLRLYAEQGYSCSQIAGLLGNATRNSVVGKLHRLGISTVNQPGGGSKKKNPTPRKSVAKSRAFATRWGASDDRVKPPLDLSWLRAADLVPLHVSLAQLGNHACRFPYGDGPFTFCGHDTLGQGSYCDQHHSLVYKAPETRQPRPDIAAINRQKYPTAAVLSALEATERSSMKPAPISEVLRRIQPLSPFHKACHLRALIASERKHSYRRMELIDALKHVVNKQLGREIRATSH